MQLKHLTTLALVGAAIAQRPNTTSICDYYTTALLMNNTAANQYTLLTLVVNTAVIGNYTKPNVGIMVPGILAAGEFNGTKVNLAPYFDGGLYSTSRNGKASAVNFLDGGGAAPLMKNMPAEGTDSNQYALLTHLYSYFGVLLGCSMVSMDGFPAYGGKTSMYEVHKFMALDANQIGYFITQVGLAAASFGVTEADATAVGMALQGAFGLKCAAAAAIPPTATPALQAICIESNCPTAPSGNCSAYEAVMEPVIANASLAGGEGVNATSTMSGSATGSATASHSGSMTASGSAATASKTGMAARFGPAAALVGAAALAFAL